MVSRSLLLGAALAGCSTMRAKPAATGPVGCCCTFGDCRTNFTHENFVKEGEFQGWTFTWHPGACTASDTYPASDAKPSAR